MTGYLDDGSWTPGWYDTRATGGEFVRRESSFRNFITAGTSGEFPAEPGRYHLYVSLACPWAHRTLIFRKLKRLEDIISVSVVEPVMADQGWIFGSGPGVTPDSVNGFEYLHQVYTAADARYTGRVTVPVLWDKRKRTIVSNESADIIRMFNSAFDAFTEVKTDYYPAALRAKIDEINALVYARINNGVYRCGFAGSQAAYERAFDSLFDALDRVEAMLGASRYLAGDVLTEADWRLFTTLVRFDAVYYVHFKCNLRRIADYPNLSRLLLDLYRIPGIADTVNMDHIKRHYYLSHRHLNPSGIVPKGPVLEFLPSAAQLKRGAQ
jgi:putative glutathione S-transferase